MLQCKATRTSAILLVVTVLLTALNLHFASRPTIRNMDTAVARQAETEAPLLPRVVINVLVNRRLDSLQRLCRSLLGADYMGDLNIGLEFHLEADQPAAVMAYVTDFVWPFGPKIVHARVVRAGLISVVVESWYPTDDNEYLVLLEDDIEVSPYFYWWVRTALTAYHRAGAPANILGISLYTPRVVETAQGDERLPISHRPFDPQGLIFNLTGRLNSPFLQQLPCSWGAVYFPRIWREFAAFMDFRTARGNLSSTEAHAGRFTIPRSTTTGWKASWKKFMIEMAWARGYFMMYPNFPNQASFSTNHMEVGEHIARNDPNHDKNHFTVPLVQHSGVLGTILNGERLVWEELPALNLFGDPYRSSTTSPLIPYHAPRPFASKNRLDVRSWRAVGEDLVVTSHEPWAGKLVSDIDDIYTGAAYHMCLQEDGNLVIYQVDISGDILAPIWETFSGSAGSIGKHLRLRLQRDGNLVLVKTKTEAIAGGNARNKSVVVWKSGYRGRPGPYFMYLHHNGVLVVYEGSGLCDHGPPVWASGREFADVEPCKLLRPKRPSTYASVACKEFVPSIQGFLRPKYGDRFSIVMSRTSNIDIGQHLTYYASLEIVDKILIVLPNSHDEVHQQDLRLGDTLVHFLPQEMYSPNSKFIPSMLVGTSAVLLLDEDVLVDRSDLLLLFSAWSQSPRSFAGFFPVSYRRVEGRWEVTNSLALEAYSTVLTKAAMFHIDLLHEYTCGLGEIVRSVVERHSWGESLAIALIGARMKEKFFPLHVSPQKPIMRSRPGSGDLRIKGTSGVENSTQLALDDLLGVFQ
jgi:hypothetical protein